MKTQTYSKDYAFLDVLQNRVNPPWYIKIILLFIPKRKCIVDDTILYYKIFRDVVYITHTQHLKDISQQEMETLWHISDDAPGIRPYGYKSERIALTERN